jgi:hypothetical protein
MDCAWEKWRFTKSQAVYRAIIEREDYRIAGMQIILSAAVSQLLPN